MAEDTAHSDAEASVLLTISILCLVSDALKGFRLVRIEPHEASQQGFRLPHTHACSRGSSASRCRPSRVLK